MNSDRILEPHEIKHPYAPGVFVVHLFYFDEYIGTSEALCAAGLALPNQFPGQPGMGKVTATIFADGSIPDNPRKGGKKKEEPGAKSIRAGSRRGQYRVFINVDKEESERRWQLFDDFRQEQSRNKRVNRGEWHQSVRGAKIIDLAAFKAKRQEQPVQRW